jgi:hypothetical protein
MFWLHRRNSSIRLLGKDRIADSIQTTVFSKFVENLEWTPFLAHHPACRYHHNHLIWVNRVPLCLGCTMMSCGAIAGCAILLSTHFLTRLPFQYLLTVGVFLYLPAVFQVWVQYKPYKILARFSLGVAVVFLFYSGLILTPWSPWGVALRTGFLLIFWLVWTLTLRVRSRYSRSPCSRCPEGRFPICSYTASRIPKLATQYFGRSDGSNPEADEFVRALQLTHESETGVSASQVLVKRWIEIWRSSSLLDSSVELCYYKENSYVIQRSLFLWSLSARAATFQRREVYLLWQNDHYLGSIAQRP